MKILQQLIDNSKKEVVDHLNNSTLCEEYEFLIKQTQQPFLYIYTIIIFQITNVSRGFSFLNNSSSFASLVIKGTQIFLELPIINKLKQLEYQLE